MGKQDITEKTLLSYNDVFADIVNVLACNGRQVIKENDLSDAQTFSQYKSVDGDIKEQERDVAKFWNKNEVHLSLIGLENQTVQDNSMPLRVIGYDGAAYRSQVHNKKETWYPVITLVLYFGTESKWTLGMSLGEQIKVPDDLKPLFNDYKINVYNVAWLTDEQINAFQSDFRIVAQYMKALRTGKVDERDSQKLKHVHEVMNLFQAISDDNIYSEMEDYVYQTQKRTGGTKVVDIFRQNYNKGVAFGRTEGIALERNNLLSLFSNLYAQGRGADVERATKDSAFLDKLLSEANS